MEGINCSDILEWSEPMGRKKQSKVKIKTRQRDDGVEGLCRSGAQLMRRRPNFISSSSM